MIDIHMLSDILKYGKMVLNVEPFFSLELEVNGPVKIVEADRTGTRMISADNTRLKARNLETEELMEYRVVLPLGDKEFKPLLGDSDVVYMRAPYFDEKTELRLNEWKPIKDSRLRLTTK